MALKYREEVVGKRFLALKASTNFPDLASLHQSPHKTTETSIKSAEWLAGTIRAASDRNTQAKDFQVLVELDETDWQKRDWLKVHEDFSVFLVEKTLVLAQRNHPEKSHKRCWWPGLVFVSLVDKLGLRDRAIQPVEFLVDRRLEFLSTDSVFDYKESCRGLDASCKEAAKQWTEQQDGQSILVSTPTVLVGFRVQVYRTEGTTQWFTAVIQNYHDTTKELTLLDDTVLEEHYESAELTQIKILDSGVIESILKGTEARITPRRSRACKEANKEQAANSKADIKNTTQSSSSSSGNSSTTSSSKQTKHTALPASSQPSTSVVSRRSSQAPATSTTSAKKSELTRKEKPKSGVVPTVKAPKELLRHSKSSSDNTKAVAVSSAPTSVIRQRPGHSAKRQRVGKASSTEQTDKKERISSKRVCVEQSDTTTPTLAQTQVSVAAGHVAEPGSVTDSHCSEPSNPTDMHIKKRRILGSNTEESTSSTGALPTGSNSESIGNCLIPTSLSSTSSLAASGNTIDKSTSQKLDKLSDSSIDGCSSGYSSATTNDSTVSPRDKDGHKHPLSSHLVMNQLPHSVGAGSTPPAMPGHISSPTSAPSNSAGRLPTAPSPLTTKPKTHPVADLSSMSRTSDMTAPLSVETQKDSPIVPYRDPDLLKLNASEHRKAQHSSSNTPQQSQSTKTPATRAMPTAVTSSAMSALHQPTAAAAAAASSIQNPLLNPLAAAQQFSLHHQQLLQQYQLLGQYRQLQALQQLNPIQQLSLLQQPHLAQAQAAQQAAQQQLLLDMYSRQARTAAAGLPTSAASWMMPQFGGDKQHLLEMMSREQELKAMDSKERAEREKQEKERAEKKRQEEEKERRQLAERKERARILQESAQQAKDAVNEHFNESLKRLPHTSSSPANTQQSMMNNWLRKGYPGVPTDSGQPQDLSLSKGKEHKPDLSSPAQRERDFAALAASSKLLPDDKQRALAAQQDHIMRSIQTGSSGQITSEQLVEEHFRKAQLPSHGIKSEQAEFNIYGYQPQSFPNRFVSKDQLRQHLCTSDKSADVQSPKPSAISSSSSIRPTPTSDLTKRSNQAPRPSAASSSSSLSNQLIQEGLIPNPAYTNMSTTEASSSSISALVNMSKNAGNHMSERLSQEKLQSVKVEGGSNGPKPVTSSPPSSSTIAAAAEQQSAHPPYMKSFKSYVENAVTQAFLKDIEEQNKKSNPDLPAAPSLVKSEKSSNGVNDTDSDTLSAPSPTLSIKMESQDSKPCHPKMKLKKEWLQRHSGEGQRYNSSSPVSVSGSMLNTSNASNHSETTTSASETEADPQGVHSTKPKKRKSEGSGSHSTPNGLQKKSKNSNPSSDTYNSQSCLTSGPHRQHHDSSSSSSGGMDVWSGAVGGGDSTPHRVNYNDEQDSIRQLAEISQQADCMEDIPYANKPLVRVNITTLKKTGQPFVQDGSCIEMAPKLTRCRECKMTPNQKTKNMPNIFCRFYAFRMLKFNRNGQICIAGFCKPSDAEPDDITIWLPHLSSKKRNISLPDVSTAKYIISNVGDEFCRLVEQEQECISWSDNKRLWKRAVQGVREMCDVCDTTLFNTHWVCHRCGFVVCIDCYRVKRKIRAKHSYNVQEENRRWLSCTANKNHEAEKLMLTSIVPGDALKIAGDLIHHVRRKHGIPSNCQCGRESGDSVIRGGQPALNAAAKEDSAVNGQVGISSTSSCTPLAQGGGGGGDNARLCSSYPQDGYRQSTFLSTSLDNKTLNTYSDDPLSLLADVASIVPSNAATATSSASATAAEVKVNGGSTEEMETETAGADGEKKPCLTLRKLLTKTQMNGMISSDKVHDYVNTVVDGKVPSAGQSLSSSAHVEKVLSSTDVHEFTHYKRRSGAYLRGRTQPIPACNLTETSLVFPDVQHSWLCEGKLLRLLDAQNPTNFNLFNQRWTLGLPIIVSNVSKLMDVEGLWTPEAFSKEFGHIRHDLIDCRRNEPLTGYQIKHFWDGFEDQSKRLEDADGNPLILKLKDWPTGEDFAESMPSRFQDLMAALPMPKYTRRNGELNLAGKLPEFFVKPDLGPKMYIAYGLAKYPQSGTTNLHLDVSDAVNVMVYVSNEADLHQDVMRLIDESDCDEMMKRRVTEDKETPGALWHIYDACDADKMRDLLNKVAEEQGMELEPYHDPIHDQQFYLDKTLRKRLAEEYGVIGYPILQCVGDAVFIPAGAPHQVQNLNGCIKVAEDFVSPEHLHHCFNLTQEFRHLSNTHSNHEDKLQVKNIIYHAIKHAVAVLDQSHPIS